MKQIRLVARFAVLVFVVTSLNVLAHGGGPHLMGTISAVDEHGLTVKSGDKKEVRVLFDEKTKFEKDGKSVSVKDLSLGDRVVVHTSKREGSSDLTAVLVKIGAASRGVPPGHDPAPKK